MERVNDGGRVVYLDARVEQHAVVAGQGGLVLAQKAQQRAVLQVLGDDEDGPVFGAHAVQLHQILVLQLPAAEK